MTPLFADDPTYLSEYSMINSRSVWFLLPLNKASSIALAFLLLFFCAHKQTVAAANGQDETEDRELVLVSSDDKDVGVTFPNDLLDVVSTLKNISSKTISVDRITSRWASTAAEIEFKKATLAPSETMQVRFKIQNRDSVGRYSHIFFVYSDNSREPIGKIAIRGFADWIIDPVSMTLDVGLLDYQKSIERTLEVKARAGESVSLTKISAPNKWFDAKIVKSGKALQIDSRKGMPWGAFDEQIVVDTDNSHQRKATFHVKGDVRGAIVPSMSPIDFGVVREGSSAEQIVRLEGEVGKKIEVGKIQVSGAQASATISECIPASISCKLLKLKLDEQTMGRAPRGIVSISFPQYDATLPIIFGGALIGKDTVVRDLAKEIEVANQSSAGISSAFRAATNRPTALEMSVPEGRGPLLKWEMANESKIFGYEIYRSTDAKRGFSRVNELIVPRLSGDGGISSVYRWRDSSAKAGEEYWYYIGVVYQDGTKESLNSAQKVLAK